MDAIDDAVADLAGGARDHRIVIVYGASDDLMVLAGALDNEVGCYDGGAALVHKGKLLANDCGDEECPYFKKLKRKAWKIKALWEEEPDSTVVWTYHLPKDREARAVTFMVHADGNPWCRGVVFKLPS